MAGSRLPIGVPWNFRQTMSIRCRLYGIQPTWLSEKASLILGKRASAPDMIQSTMQNCELIETRLMLAAAGESAAAFIDTDADPMCRQITVPVSSHACRNGSQWRSLL